MQRTNTIQAEQSRRAIAWSLLALMESNAFHHITILQVCQEARLSRRTFYRHFRTKEEVLRQLLEEMRQTFVEQYAIPGKSLKEEIYCSFEYFSRHRELLELLYRHRLFYLIKDMLEGYMRGECTEEHAGLLGQSGMERYFDSYFAGSLCSILELWVRDGFDKAPEELAAFACYLHIGAEAAVPHSTGPESGAKQGRLSPLDIEKKVAKE